VTVIPWFKSATRLWMMTQWNITHTDIIGTL